MFKFFIPLFFITQLSAAPVKILALKGNGKLIIGEVPVENYAEGLLATKEAMDSQLIQGLKTYQDKKGWKLSKISLGLGVRGSLGLGPFKFGKSMRHRFIYSR